MASDHVTQGLVSREAIVTDGTRKRLNRTCPVCKRTFSKGEHLLRHLRCHTKERPFACSTCGKAYSRNDTLKRHERSHAACVMTNASSNQSQSAHTQEGQADNSVSPTAIIQEETVSVPKDSYFRDSISRLNRIPSANQTSGQQQHDTAFGFPLLSPELVEEPVQPTGLIQHFSGENNQIEGQLGQWQYSSSGIPTSSDIGQDFGQFDPQIATWQLADDFDVDALDTALTSAISDWAMYPQPQYLLLPPITTFAPANLPFPSVETDRSACAADNSGIRHRPRDGMCRPWFTRLQPHESQMPSRAATECPGEQCQLDEGYRERLSSKLQTRPSDHILPSVAHLNLCLRLYFTRFHPIFPVVHIPTFRSDSNNALLVLSMCSIGSLFAGSTSIAAQGVEIFYKLNKAVLACWEGLLARGKAESLSMVQAALLGQTVGMLSGRPNDLVMVDAFQGTLSAWARKLGIPSRDKHLPLDDLCNADSLDRSWKDWVHDELRVRIFLALHIHDAELATMFHHEPLSRHNVSKFAHLANDSLFKAPNARKWMALMKDGPVETHDQRANLQLWMLGMDGACDVMTKAIQKSKFLSYSILESINACIVEARQNELLDEARKQQLNDTLIRWYRADSGRGSNKPDVFGLRTLWHSIFVSLYADIDMLERGKGRDGFEDSSRISEDIRAWANSLDAVRCLHHCEMIKEQVESMSLGAEPALHVPRALYTGGLVYLAYSQSVNDQNSHSISNVAASKFPEIALLEGSSTKHFAEIDRMRDGGYLRKHPSIVYSFIDLLQKVSRWGIANNFAEILASAV